MRSGTSPVDPMAPIVFVTGTDTGVGKTHAACALIRALRGQGLVVGAMKPVASGCERMPDGLRNDDALALIEATGLPIDYDLVNPYAFEPAIAPHLAARQAGVAVEVAVLDQKARQLASACDVLVVEGAGGWQVPLTERQTFADWIAGHRWPVLLVVGLRLGCLNHALLSAQSIAKQTRLAGWIANRVPPLQAEWADNVATLGQWLHAPMLACLPIGTAPPDAFPPSVIERLIENLRGSGGGDPSGVDTQDVNINLR